MHNLFLFILLASFFLSDAFVIGPNLYPLRLALPVTILFGGLAFFQKVFAEKEKIRVTPLVLFSILFFAYMFVHTFLVTGFRGVFFGVEYEVNDILNYVFLSLLVVTLFMYGLLDRIRFLNYSFKTISVFYIIYMLFAFYEIKTGNHLAISSLYNASWWMQDAPTVVYYNSNDFAAIFTLMLMYLLTNMQPTKKTLTRVGVFLVLVLHAFVLYKSQSRLSLLLFGLFLFYRHPKNLSIALILSLLGFFLVGYLGETSWYMQSMDDFAKLKEDMSFGERNSTLVRLYLYKHAIFSIPGSYGFGFGVNASAAYYQTIADPNLHYITNPHSYIFELMINSGVLSVIFYSLLNIYMLVKMWFGKNYDLLIQLIIYNLLLFSSSSSLFLWPIYLFFLLYIFNLTGEQMKSGELTKK